MLKLHKHYQKHIASRMSWLSALLMSRCPNCGTPALRTLFWRCPTCGYPSAKKIICPACGQPTERTRDWSCKWCDYPLVSTIYTMTQTERENLPQSPPDLLQAENVPSIDSIIIDDTFAEPVTVEDIVQESATIHEPVDETPMPEEAGENSFDEIMPTSDEPPEYAVLLPADETGVTLEEIHEAFKTNPDEADGNYQGKVLKVKGQVASIHPSNGDAKTSIVMGANDQAILRKVHCDFDGRFEAAVGRMSPGQKVTVIGRYNGHDVNIRLVDCMPVG